MNPLVSVIIPTYNRARLFQVAVDSVLAQTYLDWECLIVDDGSSDNSLEVLQALQQQDSRIRIFKRERMPKGAPTCRNIGLEHAKGDYVIFLDSDDYLLPFCLERRVDAFKKHSNCDFLVFPMGIKQNDNITKQEIFKTNDYLVPFLSANLPWSIICPIWKRQTLINIDGFKEGYPRFNDPELMIRVLVQTNNKYQIFYSENFDSVVLPSPKIKSKFIDKVYESLKLFIPDTVKTLEVNHKTEYKSYLANYLHLWFKYFYIPLRSSKLKQSFVLILMFYKEGIISFLKLINLTLRLFIYAGSNLLLKQPIDKLKYKELYN